MRNRSLAATRFLRIDPPGAWPAAHRTADTRFRGNVRTRDRMSYLVMPSGA